MTLLRNRSSAFFCATEERAVSAIEGNKRAGDVRSSAELRGSLADRGFPQCAQHIGLNHDF